MTFRPANGNSSYVLNGTLVSISGTLSDSNFTMVVAAGIDVYSTTNGGMLQKDCSVCVINATNSTNNVLIGQLLGRGLPSAVNVTDSLTSGDLYLVWEAKGRKGSWQRAEQNPDPIRVSCRRVVCSDGSVVGYILGAGKKTELLDSEQIRAKNRKIRNLKDFLFEDFKPLN